MSFNCTGIKHSLDELEQKVLNPLHQTLGWAPQAILLQECKASKERMMNIKIPGYRPVVSTQNIMVNAGIHQVRGCVILVADHINVQPLPDMSGSPKVTEESPKLEDVELIGVKVTGDALNTYKTPFELWNIYCPGGYKHANHCKPLITSLFNRKGDILLAGDMNSDIGNESTSQTCPTIRNHLGAQQETKGVTILNDPWEATQESGSVLDLAVSKGGWTHGFVHPVALHIKSDHYPIIIGLTTDSSRLKHIRLEKNKRYKRDEETAN